uniref:Uncharacterized protein n=1 Tax=Canis lupus familiaris TaxID=9615 RepID=A0A8C0TQ63_CANLF
MNPVVSQPGYGTAGSMMNSDWQTGMFDCFDDLGICLCGAFCPLCLSCQIASDMNECCLCGASVAMRTLYRTRFGIPVSRPLPPLIGNYKLDVLLPLLQHVFLNNKNIHLYDHNTTIKIGDLTLIQCIS